MSFVSIAWHILLQVRPSAAVKRKAAEDSEPFRRSTRKCMPQHVTDKAASNAKAVLSRDARDAALDEAVKLEERLTDMSSTLAMTMVCCPFG
jgi:hypothetical protein